MIPPSKALTLDDTFKSIGKELMELRKYHLGLFALIAAFAVILLFLPWELPTASSLVLFTVLGALAAWNGISWAIDAFRIVMPRQRENRNR